jgi:coenzyme PQQ precursor peptide PqqA
LAYIINPGLAAGIRILRVVDRHPQTAEEEQHMKWTKPEVEVIELGMEIGAYAGTA